MAGRKSYAASSSSNLSVLLQNQGNSSSNQAFDALFMSSASPSFHGMRSMVNFEDARMTFHPSLDQDENGDDDSDDCFRQPEKKRRLTVDQVQFLEKSFEVENKLEPERKLQLAKDLRLQPRQVAIWFQNRRARWKTKQLEKDYQVLKASYDKLQADYENILKEKEKLKAEVLSLTDEQYQKEDEDGSGNLEPPNLMESFRPQPQPNPVSDKKSVEMRTIKQEVFSSGNSDVLDSESPHCTDGVHSALLGHGDSSRVFEPEQSEEEEDNLSKSLGHTMYNFPKLEDLVYPNQTADCSHYEFPGEDQHFWIWSY